MPDVDSGITTPGGEDTYDTDVNSEQGFTAALARAAGREESEVAEAAQAQTDPSRDVLSALEVEEPSGPHRSPDGRFAAAETPAEEVEETPPATDEEVTSEGETEAEAQDRLLAGKYKTADDLERAYQELESRFGQQGQQFGERIAQLEQRLEQQAQPQQPQVQADLPVVDEETASRLDAMVSNMGGQQALNWVTENRPDLIDHAYRSWLDSEDPEAEASWARYQGALGALRAQQISQPAEPQQAPQQSPVVQRLEFQERFTNRLQTLEGLVPDWGSLKPHIGEAWAQAPDNVKQAIAFGDDQLEGMGWLALVNDARSRAAKLGTAAEQVRAQEQQQQIDKKKSASLATGSMRPASSGNPGSTAADETPEQRSVRVAKELQHALLNAQTTDIEAGLTIG